DLTVRPADGAGEERVLTKLGAGFRYRPFWSPDSKKIVFIDQTMRIHMHDLEKNETKDIDKERSRYHGNLMGFKVSWSKDSRWFAYAHDIENLHTAIALYDTKEGKRELVTSGYYDDDDPTFDPDGKYLYYRSGREFAPLYSDQDNTWIYPNSYQLVAAPLRKDVASPLAPRNDDEGEKKDKDKDKKDQDKKDKDKNKDKKPDEGRKKDDPQIEEKKDDKDDAKDKDKEEKKDKKSDEDEKKEEKPPKPVEIDLANFERRAVVLPPKPGYFGDLAAVSGKLIYRRLPRAGSAEEKSALVYYDFEKREDKTILDDDDDAILSAKGEKMLVRRKSDYAIIEAKEGQKFEKKVPINSLETIIDPVAEWTQIFTDAWRLERDYF